MIDFNKLTDYTQQIVLDSQKIMQKYQNSQIEPVHILFAMQEDRESVSGNFLKEALRAADVNMPYRGPELYQSGEYTYRCKVTGDFTWFQGYEEIYKEDS